MYIYIYIYIYITKWSVSGGPWEVREGPLAAQESHWGLLGPLGRPWRVIGRSLGVFGSSSGRSRSSSSIYVAFTHVYICIYIYIYIYVLYKYITYLALKTMIVQNHIKQIYTIGCGGGTAAAAANPIVYRGLILFCTHCFLG